MIYALVLSILALASCAHAQISLSSPVKILAVPTGPAPGELRICDETPSCATYMDLGISGNNASVITGRSSSNGSIVLSPGNVSGAHLSSVIVLSPGPTEPGLVLQDNVLNASNGIRLENPTGGTVWSIDDSNAGDMTFNTNAFNFDFFGGKVGIGVAPIGVLTVQGISSANIGQAVIRDSSSTHATGIGGHISLGFDYVGTGSFADSAEIWGYKENSIAGDYSGTLIFATALSGGNNIEKMRITSGGLVGIGTTNPAHQLDVAVDLDVASNTFIANSSGFFVQNTSVNQIEGTFTAGVGGRLIVFDNTGAAKSSMGASTGVQSSTDLELWNSGFSIELASITPSGAGAGQLILNNSSGQNMVVANSTGIFMQNAGTNQVEISFSGSGGAVEIFNGSGAAIADMGPNGTQSTIALQVYTSGFGSLIWNFTPTGMTIGGVAGVTCTGTPTSLFASSDGIITHC